MKIILQQLFLSLTVLCFAHQNLQAMGPAKQLSRPSHTTIANRKLYKRVFEPAKLDEFRDHGTVFHGKKVQDTLSDNTILKRLRPTAIDFIGTENVCAKILLIRLLQRGDVEAVRQHNHLKKLFATFSPQTQGNLDSKYELSLLEKSECGICFEGKYVEEVIHPACCGSNQTICLECYSKLNRCPFCRADEFIPQQRSDAPYQRQQQSEPTRNYDQPQRIHINYAPIQRTHNQTPSILDFNEHQALMNALASLTGGLTFVIIELILKKLNALRKARNTTNKAIPPQDTTGACAQNLSQKSLIQRYTQIT
jgi:hypothetical protein